MDRAAEEDLRELIRILHFGLSVRRKEYSGLLKIEDKKLVFERLDPDIPFKDNYLLDLLFNLIVLNSDKSEIETVLNSYSVKITEYEPGRFLFGTKNL